MTIREQILLLLENHRGEYFSGQQIAEQLSITRAGVWKAVKALQKDGYAIEAVNNRGYILQKAPDVLSAAFIEQTLKKRGISLAVQVERKVDSTNNVLKQYAAEGENRDMVLLAEEQSAGRGRRGRSFYSPEGTGLYMSLLLHPEAAPSEAAMLTTLTAAAAARAVETVSGQPTQIKWVNDVWMRGKKISGILTEGSSSLEEGKLQYVVVGIGINLYEPEGGFPEEVRDVAGAVFDSHIQRENLRNRLASEFLIDFMEYYRSFPARDYLEEYRKRSFVIGRRIHILTPSEASSAGRSLAETEASPAGTPGEISDAGIPGEYTPGAGASGRKALGTGITGAGTAEKGTAQKGGEKRVPGREWAMALDIDDECHLKVQYEDGTIEYLSSGEVSVRPDWQ